MCSIKLKGRVCFGVSKWCQSCLLQLHLEIGLMFPLLNFQKTTQPSLHWEWPTFWSHPTPPAASTPTSTSPTTTATSWSTLKSGSTSCIRPCEAASNAFCNYTQQKYTNSIHHTGMKSSNNTPHQELPISPSFHCTIGIRPITDKNWILRCQFS